MKRLTEHDGQGNWSLKGVAWKALYVGQVITKEIQERLYGALWKLMEYENTDLSPEEIMRLKEFEGSNSEKYLREKARHRWIPVTERLPGVDGEILASDGCFVYLVDYEAEKTDLCEAFGGYEDIKAWMPLPEPYTN